MVNVTFTIRELGLRKCLHHYTHVHYTMYAVVHTVCTYSPLRYMFSERPLLLYGELTTLRNVTSEKFFFAAGRNN
jgi:hypothetical protein